MPFEQPHWMPSDDKAPAVEREAAVIGFWKKNDIFAKSLKAREGAETFVFYEGPPTANGKPHPGHVLGRVLKDLFPRYRTMTGMSVPRKAGWDTHGLPVEIEVEKALGLSSKEDIEKYGVEPFIRKCMESVWTYTRDWEELTERIGFWLDMPSAYVTYRREYVESVWWALAELFKKGLLYKGHKIVPWCTRCGTGLSSHEVGWGYKTVRDPSIIVKFKVTKPSKKLTEVLGGDAANAYFLAWTTTPWTLLSNVALAVKPDAQYVIAESCGQFVILAQNTLGRHAAALELVKFTWTEGAEATQGAAEDSGRGLVDIVTGSDLAGSEYQPLFGAPDEMLGGKEAYRVVAADFVTLDEGTGIVHIAPAFGADDQQVGKANDLPTVVRTDPKGLMTPDTPFAGTYAKDADKEIIRDLRDRGLLVDEKQLRHEYPHCWRCDTPLLYYPRAGWFIRTTQFRDRMLELNRTIKWHPEHIQEGRFGNFLRDNVDWALSRERYWGTPLPIWQCDANCGHSEAAASLDELRARPGVTGFEAFQEAKRKDPDLSEHLAIHKPYIDQVTYECLKCGKGTMRRVREVIDCWFDSGAMPFAQWGYAGEEKGVGAERFKAAFPAGFICEAIDQTRGWFYSLLAISTMLFDAIPYRRCLVHGHVCDEKGFKMSKSKGNYVEPKEILDTQGADALRWYFLSANQPWTSVRFTDRNVAMANKDFLIKLRNVHSFFLTYSRIDGFDPAAGGESVTDARPSAWGERRGRRPAGERAQLDRWILSELATTIRTSRESLDAYDAYGASQALAAFVESLSNWYLRRSRSRFWGPDKGADMSADKSDAYWTLYEALVTTSLLVAPFTPFAAEELYQTLVRSAFGDSAPESVHLCEYPEPDAFPQDKGLSHAMALAREASALGRAARAQAKIKVRMPLSEALIVVSDTEDAMLLFALAKHVIGPELNVERLSSAKTDPDYVSFQIKPNYRTLGPRLGPKVKDLAKALANADGFAMRAELAETGSVTVDLAGEAVELSAADLDIKVSADEHHAAASGTRMLVVLNTDVTPELERKGLARELVSKIQNIRKELDLPYEARIETAIVGSVRVGEAVAAHEDYIKRETLTVRLLDSVPEGAEPVMVKVEGEDVTFAVKRA